MLTDTGTDKNNLQSLMLWIMDEERLVHLGQFQSSHPFRNEIRS